MSQTSTRAVSLIRIALAMLLWAEFAGPMRPVHHLGSDQGLLLSVLFYLASPLMVLGVYSRSSSLLTGALSWWAWQSVQPSFALDRDAGGLLAQSAMLLALTDCGGSFSFDRLRLVRTARARGESAPEERGPSLGAWLLRLQLTVLLVLRAADRSTLDFLSGHLLARTAAQLGLDGPVPGGLATALAGPLGTALSLGAFAVGLALPVALWMPATRARAALLVMVWALLLYPFAPLGTEPLTVCALAVAFLDAEQVHYGVDRMLGRTRP